MEQYDDVPEFSLVIESGGERGERFTFQQPEVTLGRTADNDLVLYDGAVSRRHIVIYYRNQQFIIEDLGSSNGTILNSYPLTQPNVLSEGDRIDIGPVRFVFTLQVERGDSTQMEVEAIPEHWVNPDPSAPIARPRFDVGSGLPVPPQGDTRAFSAHQLHQGQAPLPPVSATQHLPVQNLHPAAGFAHPQRPPSPLHPNGTSAPSYSSPQPYGSPSQPYGSPSQPYGSPSQPYGSPGTPAAPYNGAPAPFPSGPPYAPQASAPVWSAQPAVGDAASYPNSSSINPPSAASAAFAPSIPSQSSSPQSAFPPLSGASASSRNLVSPQTSGFSEASPRRPSLDRPGISLQQERAYVLRLSILGLVLLLATLGTFLIPVSPPQNLLIAQPVTAQKSEPVHVRAEDIESIYQRSFGYNQYNKLDARYLFETMFAIKYSDGKLFVSFRLIGPDSVSLLANGTEFERLHPNPQQWLPFRAEIPRGLLRYGENLITFKRVSAADNRWGLTHVRFEEKEIPLTNLRRAKTYCKQGDDLFDTFQTQPEHTPRAIEAYENCRLYLLRKTPTPPLFVHATKQIKKLEQFRNQLYVAGLKQADRNPATKKQVYEGLLKYFDDKSPQHLRLSEMLQTNP